MKYGATMLAGIMCGLALSAQARPVNDTVQATQEADSGGDPYGAIWLRNVFDLKPAPPPVTNAPDVKPPEPPPNVKLTGITTIFGKKLALFSVQPTPERGKPPEKELSYMLGEGERRGSLEVVDIMPKDRKVTIKVDDIISTITFPTNAPSSGGPPGAHPGQFTPPPGMAPPNFTPPGAPGGFPRPIRQPGFGTTAPQANNNNYSPSGYGGVSQSQSGVATGGYVAPSGVNASGGTGGLGSSPFTAPAPQLNAPAVTPILSAEQQQAAIAITHQALLESGTPENIRMATILPPVPGVTDGGNNNNSTSQSQSPTPVQQTPFGQKITGNYGKP